MRLQLSRRARWILAGGGGALVLVIVACLAFGPIVRARVASEAARRKLDVKVGAVRPGWFAVRLKDVRVGLKGVKGIDVHIDKVSIDLSIFLRPREVAATGATVTIEGKPADLAESLRQWRGEEKKDAGEKKRTPWRVDGLSITWAEKLGDPPIVDASGISLAKDATYKLGVEAAKARHGDTSIELATLSAELDGALLVKSGKAARLAITYELPTSPDAPSAPAASAGDPAPPPLPVVLPSAKRKGRVPPPTPPGPVDTTPLLPLPDVHALRARAGTIAAMLADRMPEGGLVSVDGLELQLGVRADRIALGPGPLTIERTHESVRVAFATGDEPQKPEGTRLSLEGTLPLAGDDVTLQLVGGPVALSLLGAKSGAMGLTDVDRATMTGKGRVVISGPGDALTFDVDVRVRGMAVRQPRLASDVVRGLDFGVGARGLLTDQGELRLDDAEIEMGALRFRTHGALQQTPDHLLASMVFDVPTTACQMLLDSVPSALIPSLTGARMAGTFGAHGRVGFDTRKLDDLVLDYDIADQCKMTEVPEELSRDRFSHPFMHRIYLPDGKIDDEETGPGTESWTDLDHISPYMQVAVLTTEDGAFPHHHGFNHAAIRNSLVANLKSRKFLRGASTITMQLAKNLFLTREKTLARKLEEVILTDYLEQVFRKDDIMELYLNIIEFGPNIYGVTAAADHYFGRKPEELNLAESLFLSSIMPSPLKNHRIYDKGEVPEAWMRHVRDLMVIAEKTGKISKTELAEGLAETIVFHKSDARPEPRARVGPTHFSGDDAGWVTY